MNRSEYFIGCASLALAASAAIAPSGASAAVILPVTLQFQSGASFQGDITFTDDYSRVTGVSGVVAGYALGSNVYNPAASYTVDSLYFWGLLDLAAGASNFGARFQSGTPFGAGSYLRFAYNFQNAPTLDFVNTGTFTSGLVSGGSVDPIVNGFITAVPEPGTWLLLIIGFGGIGYMLRQDRRRARASVSYSFA